MSCGANNIAMAFYKENAGNAAPDFASTPMQALRLVSEDFNSAQALDESNEVRGDAQSSGSVITGISGAGNIQLQYSLSTYDEFICAMLYAPAAGSGWGVDGFSANADPVTTTAAFTITGDVITGTVDAAPSAGDRILISGTGNRNMDTVFEVVSATVGDITLLNDTGAGSIEAYAGYTAGASIGSAVAIKGMKGYTRNGTQERLYGLVRFYSDSSLIGESSSTDLNSCDWALFRGALPTGLQLAAAPGQAGWTGTIPFIFKDEKTITNASGGDNPSGFDVDNWSEITASNDKKLVDVIDGPVMIRLKDLSDNSFTRVDPLSFNFSISNNASEITATRNPGAICINQGTMSMNVSIQLLYVDAAFHQGMLDQKFYEVEIAIGDGTDAQIWRFGKCRYTSSRPNPGRNAPVVQTLDFIVEAGGEQCREVAAASANNTVGKMCQVLRTYA